MAMVTCSSCGDEGGSQVGLPAVGTCGWRCLDDLAFACRVVAHDADGTTLSVQYADDQQVESGLHSDEFLLREPGIRAQASSLQQSEHEYGDINIHHDDYFRRLYGLVDVSQGGSASDSVVNYVASFLDHLQWMQRLALVSKRWRRALIQQQSWEILRLPQEIVCRSGAWLGTARYDAAIRNLLLQPATLRGDGDPNANTSLEPRAKVYQVVQELVFDGCPVTDALVLEFVAQCQQLKRLSLRRCSQISFLLLYELTRLTKEKESKKCERFRLQHVDVWLCRGISPAYVDQLRCNGVFTRTGLNVTGPGFFILEVSASTEQWIKRSGAEVLPLLPEDFQQQYRQEPHIEVDFQSLSVCFVSKARLRALFKETHQAARELRNLRDRVDDMPLTMIPLVCCFESVVRRSGELGTEQDTSQYSLVGIPSTPDDLVQFVAQYEERYVQSQLSSALASIVESREEWSAGVADSEDKATKLYSPEQDESLDVRAEKVFAMLRQTTQDLETQVARLESQVEQMTIAKHHAQQEYQTAQLELDRVAKEADRALLRLATSSGTLPPPPPPFPSISTISTMSSFTEPNSGIHAATVHRDGDELLPPLPSNDKIQGLGSVLQSQGFAVLDSFLGPDLSASVHRDLEELYLASQARNLDATQVEANPSDTPAEFKLGELAGGNTGRNLRYSMEHVRGDYMLWVDEGNLFCPSSLRQVLRQMDRLVLARLSSYNMELRGSSLLRKKAMVTCYPGNGTRYTRHCDNPNKNGRKLTAILYLNADWRPEHGGELQLHLPPPSVLTSSLGKESVETKIAPLIDRLLLFFSDKRVPHEVLPCFDRNRFALTLWYLDYDEFMNAQVFGAVLEDERNEEKRIRKEISGFAKTAEL